MRVIQTEAAEENQIGTALHSISIAIKSIKMRVFCQLWLGFSNLIETFS